MAIDVGHTETNYGALSAHGKPEYGFNLGLAHDLVSKLWLNHFDKAAVVIQTDSGLMKRARDLSSGRPKSDALAASRFCAGQISHNR